MNTQTKYLTLTTTVPTEETARSIAQALVDHRLAACVQISSPLKSVYRWEGKLELSTEYQLTVKTTVAAGDRAMSKICELHPYDVPEVLATPIVGGNADYLAWLETEVS